MPELELYKIARIVRLPAPAVRPEIRYVDVLARMCELGVAPYKLLY